VAFLAVLVPTLAAAHDTWLEQRPARAGRVELALTTGELFPNAQTAIAASSLVDRGCVAASGRRLPLHAGPSEPSALTLRAVAGPGDAITGCWVQTGPFDVEVPPHLVPVYLREIGAPEGVRQVWAAHRQQGLPWLERYTKHARISLAGQPMAVPPSPSPTMALDVEIVTVGRLRAGDTLEFRVLRDGQPLAGQAVELRGDMSRLGLWRHTDGEGRASVPVPFAGRWVLRATDLRPVPDRTGHWESRFVTHTFSVEANTGAVNEAHRPLAAAHGLGQAQATVTVSR